MTETAGEFAAVAVALYAAHHVGDYWVQTDHQARHKGAAGMAGVVQCLAHVVSYLVTQIFGLVLLVSFVEVDISHWGMVAGLLVSGLTHYLADRREHGLMFKLARLLPGKADFMKLGVPRKMDTLELMRPNGHSVFLIREDNPSLGTGAWALDQSWHIFWGVFVAALLMV